LCVQTHFSAYQRSLHFLPYELYFRDFITFYIVYFIISLIVNEMNWWSFFFFWAMNWWSCYLKIENKNNQHLFQFSNLLYYFGIFFLVFSLSILRFFLIILSLIQLRMIFYNKTVFSLIRQGYPHKKIS